MRGFVPFIACCLYFFDVSALLIMEDLSILMAVEDGPFFAGTWCAVFVT